MKLAVQQLNNLSLALINKVYVHPSHGLSAYVLLDKKYLFLQQDNIEVGTNQIWLNRSQREFMSKMIGKDGSSMDIMLGKSISDYSVEIESYNGTIPIISTIKLIVTLHNKKNKKSFGRDDIVQHFKKIHNNFPFNKNQQFACVTKDEVTLKMEVMELLVENGMNYGILTDKTNVFLESGCPELDFEGKTEENPFLKMHLNFEDLGIGGLKKEFHTMFRRAFVQRTFDPEIIKKTGIDHVKGIILFGPPGTGKTLIARQIGTLLNAKPPKIVNGPEILNKYIGESEKNIRELFAEAEKDQKTKKERSPLHIIIFDEIDAICKSRGSTTTGVGDQVVNQLLTKMDGVESLNNILVIGMTNRLDLIDSALLRPGRFELHIEVPLPDEEARTEIFNIHTAGLVKSEYLEDKVKLKDLAALSKNYTGAEITAVVKSAVSYALERNVNEKDGNGKFVGNDNILVTMEDFNLALNDVKPAFGIDENDFSTYKKVYYEIPMVINSLENGKKITEKLIKTNLYNTSSILLHGPVGTGKTTVAVRLALNSNFPFIKIISPKNLVGLNDYERVNYIKNIFMDAYKSELSCIILDEIESLVDYVAIGPRFSNSVLQAIKIFVKRQERNKMLVLGTTSNINFLKNADITDSFTNSMQLDNLSYTDYEILCRQNNSFEKIEFNGNISMRDILMMLENPIESNE
ncbi:SEC18-like vesicular fusion protein [Spraguea lophii 42_110]|uniref:Vesicular-fusion protein SEC18 n=1 Tax=Spraguea lophii (strain 42_110) TaxID=1358809 RepID=S7W8P9_SPRLO|nr:SEC18-like vesicular fusion protein [Spraguea lophii 42_110]